MLLALFLLDLAAGLVLFLPLVGRRNAGPKFYRMTLMIGASLALFAIAAHWNAHHRDLVLLDAAVVVISAVVLLTLRYPKRLVFRLPAAVLGIAYAIACVGAYDGAVRPPNIAWSIAGALASVAILGSIYLAMTLGHWYLVVRGMAIDPLRRLTIATLITTLAKIVLVIAAFFAGDLWREIALRQGIFFWMRAGWGLIGPLALFPMVWGTVRIRSTMAATGILYVDVVAVTIGEVLGAWLASMAHLPL
ncbi:MAG TPA: hypothetical protein VGR95_19430 [Thermoanaerobaculia bacterium]|nr:hypothetical protein [Thermoanaerobaculia bacterium]